MARRKFITVEESKRKSSRSKADLFEVLVALGLCDAYKLNKSELEQAKRELENEIRRFPDGEKRKEEQYKRAEILLPELVKRINSEIIRNHGELQSVNWVGRRWKEEETLSDIDLCFSDAFLMGISLKSTRQGSGTQKNLGYEKLKQFLGLDLDKELERMWENVRKELSNAGGDLAKIATKSQTDIKDAKYDFPVIQEFGKKHGTPVQELAIDRSVDLFNALPRERKVAFLKEILGIEQAKPILIAIVEKDIPKFYWNQTMARLIEGELVAEKIKDKSYRILANGNPLVRIQASFTNGVGLSPFCERAFLL
jgi:hypothetical protein